MGIYTAQVLWERGDAPFVDNRFSRRHTLKFDGGVEVVGSASPLVLPPPMSEAAALDPEEAYVGALSSCHMLFFLLIAAHRKYRVDQYEDNASGVLEIGADEKLVMTRITLRPYASFSGSKLPTSDDIDAIHDRAHARCFLANSVLTAIVCEPVY